MTLFTEATKLLAEIQDRTQGLKTGEIPSLTEMLYLQGQVVSIYGRLGDELASAFSNKETANLSRKVQAARHHLKNRREFKMTVEDSRTQAIEETEAEYKREIEAMSFYEQIRILRDSLGRAFDYLSMVTSTVKFLENRPTS